MVTDDGRAFRAPAEVVVAALAEAALEVFHPGYGSLHPAEREYLRAAFLDTLDRMAKPVR